MTAASRGHFSYDCAGHIGNLCSLYLRLTKFTGNKSHEKLGNPGSAPAALISPRTAVAKVFNGYGEAPLRRRRQWAVAKLFDVEHEFIRSKSKPRHFRRECELIPARKYVTLAPATNRRLPLFGKAQVC